MYGNFISKKYNELLIYFFNFIFSIESRKIYFYLTSICLLCLNDDIILTAIIQNTVVVKPVLVSFLFLYIYHNQGYFFSISAHGQRFSVTNDAKDVTQNQELQMLFSYAYIA